MTDLELIYEGMWDQNSDAKKKKMMIQNLIGSLQGVVMKATLVIDNLADSRDPRTEKMIEHLDALTNIKESVESYFGPDIGQRF